MLDTIIKWSIKHKLAVAFGTLMLVLWGIWSATRLAIDAVPDITNNQIQIITTAPSLATQEVEQLVTAPIERQMSNIPGRVEMRSISRFGLSVITLVFEEHIDDLVSRQMVSERLQQVASELPEAVDKPELAPMSTGLGEVYQYILKPKKAGAYSPMQLRELQDWVVARQLNGTRGVAEVNSFGGFLKQYEVSVDPNKLRAMGVSIGAIYEALAAGNQNTGGAYIDKKPNAYFIRGVGMVGSLDEIGQIAVRSNDGNTILIRDLAKLSYGSAIRYGALSVNGREEAVGGIVMMLKGENSHQVVENIKKRLSEIQKSLPSDVLIEPYLDRTDLIDRAIATVEKNLLEGALIVIFVLVLFLGNLRAGMIVASAIPLSLLFALAMMNLFGVSANLMSLGAIDFGLIVDGAVIVVEATLHHLALRKSQTPLTQSEMDDEVYHSAAQIRSSATFGEIIILIVYIPIFTLVGVEGKMFAPMAMTVGFAIIGALILSLTYIPMMCARFLSKTPSTEPNISDRMMQKVSSWYAPKLEWVLRRSKLVLSTTIGLFVLALVAFSRMGGEFIPQLQEGDFAYQCVVPQGASLSQSVATSMQAARIMMSFPEVKTVVGKTGSAEVPTDPMPPEATDMMVVLHPKEEWPTAKSYEELANEISEKLKAIPGVYFEKSQPIQMRFNELMTGVRQDVAVKIFGENLDSLAGLAVRVAEVVKGIDGATDPQVEAITGLPQISVEYDRLRLANHGISIQEVNDALSSAFAGRIVGQAFENERSFDVVVRLDSTYRQDIEDVRSLPIATQNGSLIPLGQLARIDYKLGPAQISREDGKRRIVIGFNVSGRDVASVVGDLRSQLAELPLPTGYYLSYGGQFENLEAASARLMIAVPVSLLLIFGLLYITFGSARWAMLIFTAIPMSAIGGVAALLLRGMPFSISAGIGFIALFGVAVLNGIVLVGTFNRLEREGEHDILVRIRRGAAERLRPVLMTATVASIGFLPMALSTSSGAEVQKPLATVVIGGLISATILTLFVLPILYKMFSQVRIHRPRVKTALCLLLLCSTSTQLGAQQSNKPTIDKTTVINLLDAELGAISTNRRLDASRWRSKSAMTLQGTSSELPKLSLSGQYGQFSSMERDLAFTAEQSIPFPTLFAARRRLLRYSAQLAQKEEELVEKELRAEVRSTYYTILYLSTRLRQSERLDSLYASLIKRSELRQSVGEDNGLALLQSRSRQLQQSLALGGLRTQLTAARSKLARLIGIDSVKLWEQELNLGNSQMQEYLKLCDEAELSSEESSQAKRAKALVEQTRAEGALLRAEQHPELVLGYTNQSIIGMHSVQGVERWFGRDKRFHSFNFGVNIPLSFGANRAKRKAHEEKVKSEELDYTATLQELRELGTTLANEFRQALTTYERYRDEGLPQAQRMLSASETAYRAGEASHIELARSIELYIEAERSYLDAIYNCHLIGNKLKALMGDRLTTEGHTYPAK
ncbi:MAG: CusA/CzcA family heavy metal efflux RND transporter [Porphyromonas sp.]|nr:CusA/CzcA family heavy metal efflux RND transporter [Porphyromonas sp.]